MLPTRPRLHPSITPGLLYHEAPQAIAWLGRVFGLQPRQVVPGEPGQVRHAHLVLGNGGVMLSSAEGESTGFIRSPRGLDGPGTAEVLVQVDDIEAHYRRAVAEGAEILLPLEDKPYGGRGYACRDLEGHVWAFGSYDAWADEAAPGRVAGCASGEFEVSLQPLATREPPAGPLFARRSLDKRFHGDLEAIGRGEMLSAGTPVTGSAAYVAIEWVEGLMQGRRGSFVLQHSGSMARGDGSLAISVVPDSGSGEFTGLAGRMAITIREGRHCYRFDYTLPEPPAAP
jgi:uncharacterized glyoxalase superfamily protein PhnB